MENLSDLWALISAIPSEVMLPALAVFIFVGILKALNVAAEANHARFALAILSFVTGGSLNASTLPEALVMAGIVGFAALFHRIWEWIKELLKKNGGPSGASLVAFAEKPLGK